MSHGGMIAEALVTAFGDGTTLGELTTALATKADQSALDDTNAEVATKAEAAIQALYAGIIGDDGTTRATGSNPLSYAQNVGVLHKWVELHREGDDISIGSGDKTRISFARRGLYLAHMRVSQGVNGYHGSTYLNTYLDGATFVVGPTNQQKVKIDNQIEGFDFSRLFVVDAAASFGWGAAFNGGSAAEQSFEGYLTVVRIA